MAYARDDIFDDDARSHGGTGEASSFERIVEAAASVADLYDRAGYAYRLMGAVDKGVPTGRGNDHHRSCLDVLAQVAPAGGSTDALAARLAELENARTAEAALVAVTGTLSPEAAVRLTRSLGRFRQITVISYPAHRFTGTTRERWEGETAAMDVVRLLTRSGIRTLVLGPDESLPLAWNSSIQTSRRETAWDPKQKHV